MPDVYVDSNATAGLNDGTSWANAYLLLSSAMAVAAGGEIWVASNHAEGATAALTLAFTNGTPTQPIRVVSVNSGTNAYAAGALISGTGIITLQRSCHCFGVTFKSSVYSNIGQVGGNKQTFHACTFWSNSNSNSYDAINNVGSNPYSGTEVELIDCVLQCGTGTGEWITNLFAGSKLLLRNCTFSGGANKAALIDGGYSVTYPARGQCVVEDMDLSGVTKLATTGTGLSFHVKRCKLHASFQPSNANDLYSEKIIENCDDGTISVPPIGLTWYQTLFGDVKGVSAVYRTGGADDGETDYSWSMVSQSTAIEGTYNAISTPPITRWVAGGVEIDITVYVAGGATMNNDDVWVEISGPDNTANPGQTANGYTYSSRMAILGTPAALTTDSVSTWNGTGVGTKQKITHTYTPTEAGPVTVRVFLAKPSTTVYVDPKLEIT